MSHVLYHDNDADITVRRLPSTAAPQWAVVTDPSVFPPQPIHGDLTGTLTWNATRYRHEAVIEGHHVTAHLPPTNELVTPMTPLYAIVIWWEQNVRKVVPDVVVRRVRT